MNNRQQRRGSRKEKSEFDQEIIDIARVTRVMAGGKRMRFRATVVIGDRKGRLGLGIKKGADVTIAINKAVEYAKKHVILVPLVKGTLPHEIRVHFCGADILMKPTGKGRGIIAGGALRPVFELAGVKDVVAKILGSNGKINNVRGALKGLSELKTREFYQQLKVK